MRTDLIRAPNGSTDSGRHAVLAELLEPMGHGRGQSADRVHVALRLLSSTLSIFRDGETAPTTLMLAVSDRDG